MLTIQRQAGYGAGLVRKKHFRDDDGDGDGDRDVSEGYSVVVDMSGAFDLSSTDALVSDAAEASTVSAEGAEDVDMVFDIVEAMGHFC